MMKKIRVREIQIFDVQGAKEQKKRKKLRRKDAKEKQKKAKQKAKSLTQRHGGTEEHKGKQRQRNAICLARVVGLLR